MTKKLFAFIMTTLFCCAPMLVNAGEIVDVTEYGAKGDDKTYNDKAFRKALEAVPANGSLFIPSGVYKLSDEWDQYTFEVTHKIKGKEEPRGPISIFGTGKNTSIIKSANDEPEKFFLKFKISVNIQDVGFDSWKVPLAFSNEVMIDRIDISDCDFNNCFAAINHNRGAALPPLGCNDVVIKGCSFKNIKKTAIHFKADIYGRVLIADNLIQDLTSDDEPTSAIAVGNNDILYADQRQNIIIRGNTISNIFCKGDKEVQGIIIKGTRAIITGNTLKNITKKADAEDCEGIYTKCKYTNISNNILIDAGMKNGMIDIAGTPRSALEPEAPSGWAVICTGNVLIGSGTETAGINIRQEDVLVANNYIEGMSHGGIISTRTTGEGADNVRLEGNLIRSCLHKPINAFGIGSRLSISGNTIYNTGSTTVTGPAIKAENESGYTSLDWEITDNLIVDVKSINGACVSIGNNNREGGTIIGVKIEGNTFVNAPRGISLISPQEGSTDKPLADVSIRGNRFRYIGEKIRLPTTPISNISIQDNDGFVTESAGMASISPLNCNTPDDCFLEVYHNLDSPIDPLKIHVSVTPTNKIGSATKYWISDLSGTSFILKVDKELVDKEEASFAWRAMVVH